MFNFSQKTVPTFPAAIDLSTKQCVKAGCGWYYIVAKNFPSKSTKLVNAKQCGEKFPINSTKLVIAKHKTSEDNYQVMLLFLFTMNLRQN